MDPRLLRLYSDELGHLREVGAEFAREFPKVAGRLGLESLEVADPYVERLLEGVAFLAARVQLKLEAEHPRLIAHLLESLYPNFLAPVPSMMVARLHADATDPNLIKGFKLARGSALTAPQAVGQDTRCEFRTAHPVTLWPLELVSVRYFVHAPDIALPRLPQGQHIKSGLRMRLKTGAGLPLRQLGLDQLDFYLSAADDVALRLHELVLGHCVGSYLHLVGEGAPLSAQRWSAADSVQPLGYDPALALLPEGTRAFSGHRLMQEFAAMPQRLWFFTVQDLARRLAQVPGGEVELVLLFDQADAGLESQVDASALALNCTPAINLFPKRLDRIRVGPGTWEHHVVPDRTRPMDFEVHSLSSVQGYGTGPVAQQRFVPMYGHLAGDLAGADGCYTLRRERRLLSPRQVQQGTRSSYVGDEVFVSLVDARHAPYAQELRQLSVEASVSNRDLPTLLPSGSSASGWICDASGPVRSVEVLRGPTRPVSRHPVGDLGWQLVRQLSGQHLDLLEEGSERGAGSVRDTLKLYGPPEDAAWTRLVDGVRGVQARQVVRRLPFPGPLTYGTGVELGLEIDEMACQGSSAFLLASVLEHFFRRHAAINTFTQLVLRTPQRGEVHRWAPRAGLEAVV